MQDCNKVNTLMLERLCLSKEMSPLTPEEEIKDIPYREAVGKLLYLAVAT